MANKFTIQIEQRTLQEALRKAPVEVSAAVDIQLARGGLETARRMREHAPKAMSTLVNSITSRREALMAYRIGPTVQYAMHQEQGVRGGGRMPPVSAISDWVRTKLGISDLRARRDVAWAVARKLQRDGIRARPFVRPVYEDTAWTARIEQLVRQGIDDGLRMAGKR